MATQVAVITATTGAQTFYSDYASARSAASSGDLIQIWADLTEQLLLKNGVDIWIAPGRVISVSAKPTILDNSSGYTTAVTCNITGYGIIKNQYEVFSVVYECVKIVNTNSKVSIMCDYIEGLGGTDQSVYAGVSVLVNASDSSSFSLICNRVTNKNNAAILIQNMDDSYLNQINIKAKLVETGLTGDSDTGTSAMIIEGGGFIEIDEVICKNYGSCLIHRRGTITATILKLTTNNNTSTLLPTVSVSDGDGTQNLTLYFDEINNIGGGEAVKIAQGSANIIGRSIYSNSGFALNLVDYIVSAFFQCVDIISGERCININNNDQQIIVDANYIEGNTAESDGVVYCSGGGNFSLKNAKIKNVNVEGTTPPYSIGIYLGSGTINMELENIIIVASETSSNSKTIVSASARDVKNLGLFVNKPISANITLKIGTEVVTGNYKYIVSGDIT